MSRLTTTQYNATYNEAASGSFPDNTVRAITEAVVRQFGQDLLDSFVFAYAPVTDGGATFTLSHYGPHIHSGSGGTWTLYAGSSTNDGKEVIITNKGSGNITVSNSTGTVQTVIFPNATKRMYWDNTGNRWIIY